MNRTSIFLFIFCICLFHLFQSCANAGTYLTKHIVKNSTEFAVQANQVNCYNDSNGAPGRNIVKKFYRGNRIWPQKREDRSPYAEHNNKAYLWAKYNDSASEGCFIEININNIFSVEGWTSKTHEIKCVHHNEPRPRYIKTTYESFPAELPCQVIYFKENGTKQIIARAQTSTGYCERERNNLLKKLNGGGWSCQ
jgi:hypothetical protein